MKKILMSFLLMNYFVLLQSSVHNLFFQNVFLNHIDAVQTALQDGVDVNCLNEDGLTALMVACYYGYKPMVQLLLDYDASMNIQNNQGYTALMYATRQDQETIMQLLIDHGADVNLANESGWTALMYAIAFAGRCRTVQMLLDAGADIEAENELGYTALMIAQAYDYDYIAELLEIYGALE